MSLKLIFTAVAVFISAGMAQAADPDVSKLPKPADKKVEYAKDIKPILESCCLKCHGAEKPKSKYRVDSREAMIKGGDSETAAIVVGKSEKSPLVHFIADLVEDMEMPPKDKREKYPALKPEQIALIRAWIDQGAKWE